MLIWAGGKLVTDGVAEARPYDPKSRLQIIQVAQSSGFENSFLFTLRP